MKSRETSMSGPILSMQKTSGQPIKTSVSTFDEQPYQSHQLLTNSDFTLWENSFSPVGWKGEGINREDDLAFSQNGKFSLRMPANSQIYQYIAQGLQPNTLYLMKISARMGDKNWDIPLVASIQFFNEVGVQVGYTTQITIDATAIKAVENQLKVYAEAPQTTKIARVTLTVTSPDHSDYSKSYLIDEVTMNKY